MTLPNRSRAEKATVYLRRSTGGKILLSVSPLTAHTDRDGKFVFADVEWGSYRVWAEHSKFTSLSE